MNMLGIKSWMVKTGSALRRDSRGGAAIMIALSAPVVIGAMGIAIDTGLWYMEKRRLQQQADAASLGAVRALQAGATKEQAKAIALADATRNGLANCPTCFQFNSPPTSGAYAGNNNAVEIVIQSTLKRTFSAIFLSHDSTLHTRSVSYQNSVLGKNLEVALMLDVSESMNGSTEIPGKSKLQAMREAAKAVVDTVVQPNQATFKSRVALVPYSSAINVGSTYYTAVTNKTSSTWSTVVERSGTAAFTDDAPGPGKYLYTFKDRRDDAMGAYASTVKNYNSNVPKNALMHPLSASKSTLTDAIDDFDAKGTTAGHLGIAWTWYTLSPKWATIFSNAANKPAVYDPTKTLKVAVLLSDFDMNSYYVSGNGNSSVQSQKLCDNMKAAGIVIYTVGYGLDTKNSTAVNLWKNCATSANHRFTTTTADGLISTFKSIAQSALGGASVVAPGLVE